MKNSTEVKWLLKFFAQPFDRQRSSLPQSIPRVWVHVGEADCDCESPTEILAVVLTEIMWRTREIPEDHPRRDELLDLFTEIWVLLHYVMFDPRNARLFEPAEEPDQIYALWGILARLCSAALEHPIVKSWEDADLSLEHFLESYAYPME